MSKNRIVILFIVLIIIISFIIFYKLIETNKEEINLDNSNKYIIITDFRWKTMLNDGGSHTNIYYEIDLDKNNVNKVTESYLANLGGKPKTSKNSIFIKIDSRLSKELSRTLNNIFQTNDINDANNYDFYTIKKQNEEKNIYNEDTIHTIQKLIDKIESER